MNSKEISNRWYEFEQHENSPQSNGRKRLIPILGSGFNIQAWPDSYNWGSLLFNVAQSIGLNNTTLHSSSESGMTSIWEQLVIQCKDQMRLETTIKAENLLRKIVADCLKRIENNRIQNGFLLDFLNLGFKDIISINFDRLLALDDFSTNRVIVPISKKAFNAQNTIFRHAQLKNKTKTRIWYAHGDTENYQTIKFGVRSYGLYIRSLSAAFKSYRDKRDETGYASKRFLSWCNNVRSFPVGQLNWFWLGLSSPIIFLGCSLSTDEWPLWWFLHQRARHLAHYTDGSLNPVFILWNVNNTSTKRHEALDFLLRSPANISVLPCRTWKEGWDRFMNIHGR